jgi:hypothetical protein
MMMNLQFVVIIRISKLLECDQSGGFGGTGGLLARGGSNIPSVSPPLLLGAAVIAWIREPAEPAVIACVCEAGRNKSCR